MSGKISREKVAALGTIGNSRSKKQREAMQRSVGQGICPFCKINRKVNPVDLRVGQYWVIRPSAFPYRNTRKKGHFVLTTVEHHTHIDQISPEAWAEWGEINTWATKEFDIPGGGLVMRFGEAKFCSSSITHVHSHIVVPNRRNFCGVIFYLSKRARALIDDANTGPRKKRRTKL